MQIFLRGRNEHLIEDDAVWRAAEDPHLQGDGGPAAKGVQSEREGTDRGEGQGTDDHLLGPGQGWKITAHQGSGSPVALVRCKREKLFSFFQIMAKYKTRLETSLANHSRADDADSKTNPDSRDDANNHYGGARGQRTLIDYHNSR